MNSKIFTYVQKPIDEAFPDLPFKAISHLLFSLFNFVGNHVLVGFVALFLLFWNFKCTMTASRSLVRAGISCVTSVT